MRPLNNKVSMILWPQTRTERAQSLRRSPPTIPSSLTCKRRARTWVKLFRRPQRARCLQGTASGERRLTTTYATTYGWVCTGVHGDLRMSSRSEKPVKRDQTGPDESLLIGGNTCYESEGRRFESCRARSQKRPICSTKADRLLPLSGALSAMYYNKHHNRYREFVQ